MAHFSWRGITSKQSVEQSAGRSSVRRLSRLGRKAPRKRGNFGFEPLEARVVMAADIIISEVAASNNSLIADSDGDHSDWIEIFNNGDAPQSLAGWYLSDIETNKTLWQFPTADPSGALVLDPDEYMIVFASDKNRRIAGNELHANFRLTSNGEYLGLTAADGTTVVSEYKPFPAQYADTTWGPEQTSLIYDYLTPGAPVSVLLPASAGQDVPTATWTAPAYNDAAWTNRNFGIGFDGGNELDSFVSPTGDISSMQGSTASAYIRSEFNIDGAVPNLDELDLSVNYDDGFIAYLNGTEIARRNAPAGPGAWNSQASQGHGGVLANLNVASFTDTATRALFQTVGSSTYSGARARLTNGGPSATGAIWTKDAVPFGHDYTFSASMAIDVHSPFATGAGSDGDGAGANGMTFVIQNGSQFHIGNSGGALGLDGLAADYVAIEFDTFATGSFDSGDVLPTHIGIDVSGVGSVARVAVPRFNGGAQGANIRYAWVDYDGPTTTLRVYFSSTNTKPAAPTLSTVINLADHFGGVPSAWVGWTATTAVSPTLSWNVHDVVNFQMQTQSNELGAVTEVIDIDQHAGLLQSGTNVLAIHGLNQSSADDDFLMSATLQGRQNDVTFKDRLRYYTSPTPRGPNGSGTIAPAGRVTFSELGKTFSQNFSVSITADTAGNIIRYTTDGTVPDGTSTLYTGPINVSSTVRIRARAFADGFAPGAVQSQTFIKLASSVANFEGGVFKSNLPIVVFDGLGKTTIDTGFGAAQPKLTPVAGMVFDVGADGYARLSNTPDMRVNAGMRVRGQTSEGFAKKQYAIEFWEDTVDFDQQLLGSSAPDEDHSFLGLPSDSDWVINGPYSDKTQLNNFMTFNLYREIGQYAPRTKLIEVFVSNNAGGELDMAADYRGTYVLLEKIKLSGDRVDGGRTLDNPAINAAPTDVGGYIWKKDKDGFGDVNFASPNGVPLKFHEPDAPNAAQKAWLEKFVKDFEDTLDGPDFADPVNGYRKYIDVQSWYDTWLMVELTKQIDGYRLSTYYHLDDNGKIVQGPAWDYNLSFANANYLQGGRWDTWYATQVGGNDYPFWPRLFQDPEFVEGLHDRWFELRQTVFTEENILGMIDSAVNDLTNGNPINSSSPLPGQGSNPISRNFTRWGTVNTYQWPNCYFPPSQGGPAESTDVNQCGVSPLSAANSPNGAPNSYDDYIVIMKNFVRNRLTWIDGQFGPPPEFSPTGGIVAPNTNVTLATDLPGEIYYTTDGTDPEQLEQRIEEALPVLVSGGPVSYVVPTSASMAQACTPVGVGLPNAANCYMNPNYVLGTNGETWATGTTGIGFDSGDGNFSSLLDTAIAGMQGTNASVYLRIPFTMTQQEITESLRFELNVNYDDGFVAYFWSSSLSTPVEVARRNAPGAATILPIRPIAYNAVATADRTDAQATTAEKIDISNRRAYLRAGQNYLVVQLLNSAVASNDLLFDVSIDRIIDHIAFPDNVKVYNGPITINENQIITARSYDEATEKWSSRAKSGFYIDVPPIVVTEINYNPSEPTQAEQTAGYIDNDDFEYIELMNVGTETIDLTGYSLAGGVDYEFTEGSLAPGARGVVVRNPGAFALRYPGIPTLASWRNTAAPNATDALDNTGESLRVLGTLGEPAMDFSYNDAWYDLTDGEGYSLVIRDPNASATTWGTASSWRPSDSPNGSPGSNDSGLAPLPGSIVINEILANNTSGSDALELWNTTNSPVDIGNFYLTDDAENPNKYRVPAGTIVPARGYLVINNALIAGFALSNTGGDLELHAATAAGDRIGFHETRRFDAADPNVPEGIYTNSRGNVDFVSLNAPTLGSANALPKPAPVIINEIMYNPLTGTEWVEIYNTTNGVINLGADRYVLHEGLDFAFPAGSTLASNSYAVIIQGTDGGNDTAAATAFRTLNGVPAGVNIYVYQPTANGNLNNGGEDLAIGRSLGTDLPAVPVELIEYNNGEGWPSTPNGTGPALARIVSTMYGNDPLIWGASTATGTPGRANGFTGAPGDLNGDGTLDASDIDMLQLALRLGSTDSRFDLNASGGVSHADVDHLVIELLDTDYGDVDLNGVVDATDFGVMSPNLFSNGGWASGDFTGDGRVDGSDFNLWNQNKFVVAPAAPAATRTPRAAIGIRSVVANDTAIAALTTNVERPSRRLDNQSRRSNAGTVEYRSVNSDFVRLGRRQDLRRSTNLAQATQQVANTMASSESVEDAFANWGL